MSTSSLRQCIAFPLIIRFDKSNNFTENCDNDLQIDYVLRIIVDDALTDGVDDVIHMNMQGI